MRILVLGGDGMLGHQLLRGLAARHSVRVSLRKPLDAYREFGIFNETNSYGEVDVRDTRRLADVFDRFRPEVVINAVGVVKQRLDAEPVETIEINALFPHRLLALARTFDARVVQISTDCVFYGSRGMYREDDVPDAADLYGRSKLLGELVEDGCITLRTSIIGPELTRKTGLLEWFLAQQGGSIRGFKRAIFSGFTTFEMTRIVERVVTRPGTSGLYHVSSEPISKYELLSRIRTALNLDVRIEADETFICDRSLESSRFRQAFEYEPPTWDAMIGELAGRI